MDYLDLVSNGMITIKATLRENPNLVRRMVGAILCGIQNTVDHPREAFEICFDYVEGLEEVEQKAQYQVLQASLKLYQTDPYGYSHPETWANMHEVLLEMG